MQEIIKFRQSEAKKGQKGVVSNDDIQEIGEEYENMIYEKEENQIQQESDTLAQQEEVRKVEATIAACEKQLKDLERQNKQLDYELGRNNA